MLVRVEGRKVQTHPIAGTRPRGKSEEAESRLRTSRAVKEAQVVAQGGENLDPMKKYEVDQRLSFDRWKAEQEFALERERIRMDKAKSIFEAATSQQETAIKAKAVAKKSTPSKGKGAK